MKTDFIKPIRVFIIQLLMVAGFLFLAHVYLYSYLGNDIVTVLPLWQVYVFHIIVVFAIYAWVLHNYVNGKKELFNFFMIGTFIKMILAIIFLLPVFLSDMGTKRPDVFNFFIPYFVFLAFEMFSITRLTNKVDC